MEAQQPYAQCYGVFQQWKGRGTNKKVFKWLRFKETDHIRNRCNTFIKMEKGKLTFDDGSKINQCGVKKDNKRIYCCKYCFQSNQKQLFILFKQKMLQWGSFRQDLYGIFDSFQVPKTLEEILAPQLKELKTRNQGDFVWTCINKSGSPQIVKSVVRAANTQAGTSWEPEVDGVGDCGTVKNEADRWCCQTCYKSGFN